MSEDLGNPLVLEAVSKLGPGWVRAGQFKTHIEWVNKARSWIGGLGAACFDQKGRRCFQGSDFRRAEEEGAFPIVYYAIHEDHILPKRLAIPPTGIMTATIGRAEPEMAAALIVKYHQEVSPNAWIPFSPKQLSEWMESLFNQEKVRASGGQDSRSGKHEVLKWFEFPMYAPDFKALVDLGMLVGWIPDEPESCGRVTPAFLHAMRTHVLRQDSFGQRWELTSDD